MRERQISSSGQSVRPSTNQQKKERERERNREREAHPIHHLPLGSPLPVPA